MEKLILRGLFVLKIIIPAEVFLVMCFTFFSEKKSFIRNKGFGNMLCNAAKNFASEAVGKTGQYMRTSRFLNRFRKYKDREKFLKETGLDYMMGRFVKPEEFMLFKAVCAIFAGIAGASAASEVIHRLILSVVLAVLGFYLPDAALKISNKSDNSKILPDIRLLYDFLRIKSESGVYVSNAIKESYQVVENDRLKTALYEMSMEMLTADVSCAVDNFNEKFNNVYIDTLCMIFRQSLESGRMVEMFDAAALQMNDCTEAINENLRNSLEIRVVVAMILLYGLMLLLLVFSLADSFGGMNIMI